jgi:anti-sigma regulatory factor (Ser/Thr protein kinase)
MPQHPFLLADVRIDPDRRPAAAARQTVARALDGADGVVAHTGRARADAELVVSELVSNAVRHGGGLVAVRVGVTPDGAGLWLEVDDANEQRPQARRVLGEDPCQAGGFGWPIVLRLATSVEVEDMDGGKRIRVVLPLT